MSRAVAVFIALTLVIALISSLAASLISPTRARASPFAGKANNQFCSRLGKSLQASQGAWMFCFGSQASSHSTHPALPHQPPLGTNVDAASPQEDRSPAGVQAYGQSETSLAAVGPYVVEAWNDATGFIAPCDSPMNKAELTGFGFSNNGGKSFTDLGGLPNAQCATTRTFGDPSVEAYQAGGSTYFYISSIFIPSNRPQNSLSVTACQVVGAGTAATLSCSQPIIAAISSQCVTVSGTTTCSFLDKGFLALDPAHAKLYLAYTEFGVQGPMTNGQIELAVCSLSNPARPVCFNGSNTLPTSPYLVVAPPDLNCEHQGAYPAVDMATGDVYVAHEFNEATNLLVPACQSVPTTNQVDRVPAACLTLTATSACTGPTNTQSIRIVSLDAAFIPGYNRFPANDFPRIAVSHPAGTVSIVWNDARLHPLGDIFLQSFALGSLSAIQSAPVKLNTDQSGALHFLPALRNADAAGRLSVAWYDRRPSANTALTHVFAALSLNPRLTQTPSSNVLVTTQPTDWNAVSSDIQPNFGDYIDTYVGARGSAPFTGNVLYVAWSDGRIGTPQPFEANTTLH